RRRRSDRAARIARGPGRRRAAGLRFRATAALAACDPLPGGADVALGGQCAATRGLARLLLRGRDLRARHLVAADQHLRVWRRTDLAGGAAAARAGRDHGCLPCAARLHRLPLPAPGRPGALAARAARALAADGVVAGLVPERISVALAR